MRRRDAIAVAVEEPLGPPEICLERWTEVLCVIRDERPSLAASLADAVASAVSDGALCIRVPNGTKFHKDQLGDRANMQIMENAASHVFGGRVRVKLAFTSADERSGTTSRAPHKTHDTPEGDGGTLRGNPGALQGDGGGTDGDPMVQKVLDIFNGRITTRSREE
jgi:hypothetical protein